MLHDRSLKTADSRTYEDAYFIRVCLFQVQSGVAQRLPRGVNAILCKAIGAPDFLWRWKCGGGIEGFYLSRDLCVILRGIEGGDSFHAAFAGDQSIPERVEIVSNRR